jgi:type I restriction enzyme, R subunit
VIIEELNERFGLDLGPEEVASMEVLETSCARIRPPEQPAGEPAGERRLSFEQIAKDQLHDMVERNFALYQRINRDEEFQRVLMDLLFGRMLKVVGEGEGTDAGS